MAEEADAAAGGGGSKGPSSGKNRHRKRQGGSPRSDERERQKSPPINGTTDGGGASSPSPLARDGAPKSKRSALKQPNTKNVWPQHPKIHDPERRARAYLRAAGLAPPSASSSSAAASAGPGKTSGPASEKGARDGGGGGAAGAAAEPDEGAPGAELKFGRLLGGADQRVRHRAVRQLRQYLKSKCAVSLDRGGGDADVDGTAGGISELELLKLCKALWYTLYMADKAVVQDELASQIAGLLWCFVGTPDEDNYAGECYWNLASQEEEEMEEDGSSDEGEGEGDDSEGDDSEDDDDPDVVMEELVNTFRATESDEDDGGSEDGRDSVEEEGPEVGGDSASDEEEDDGEDDGSDSSADGDSRLVPHCRGAHLTSLFVRCLLRTIRREWHRMDKYRLDKFYTLLRYLVHQTFRYLSERDYHPGIVQLFNDAYFEEALGETPNGIRYHLMDVAVDELCAVVHSAGAGDAKGVVASPPPFTADDFLLVLEPYFALAQHGCGDDSVHQRAVEKVLLRFLDGYSVVRPVSDDEAEGGESAPAFRHVHVGTVAQFIFNIASDPNTTKESYRKNLYEAYKAFSRRLKRGTDVDMTTIPSHEYSDEDDVDGDGDVGGDDSEVPGAKVAEVASKTEANVVVSEKKPQNHLIKNSSQAETQPKLEHAKKKTKKAGKRISNNSELEQKRGGDVDGVVPDGTVAEAAAKTVTDGDVNEKEMRRETQTIEKTERSDDTNQSGSDASSKAAKKKAKKEKKKQTTADAEHETKQGLNDIYATGTSAPGNSSQQLVSYDATNARKATTGEAKPPKKGRKSGYATAQAGSLPLPSHSEGPARLITEEELLITVKTQRAAREAAKEAEARKRRHEDSEFLDILKSKSKKRGGGTSDPSAWEEDKKRVKIGEHFNRARSYAASMKGLRTFEPPAARAGLAPDRGILLNKGAAIVKKAPAGPRGGRRRRAVDYF